MSGSTGSSSSPAPDGRRFPSRFSVDGSPVTAIQWLAEHMTAKQAAKEGVTLQRGFWRTSVRWEKVYRLQTRAASSLLRLYSLEAVGAALRSARGKSAYSLAAPWLTDIVAEEQRRLDVKVAAAAALEPEPAVPPDTHDSQSEALPTPAGRRPPAAKKKGRLDQLEGL